MGKYALLIAAGLAAAPAAADTLVVTSDPCPPLVRHEPEMDVAYQAGVDAAGNPVAPADLAGGTRLDIDPEQLVIPIEVPNTRFAGTVGNQPVFEGAGGAVARFDATVEVGEVTLQDGEPYLNGQPLSDPDYAGAAAAQDCRERLP
jgi:hypothetical protein